MRITARYFDGKSAVSQDAALELFGSMLHVRLTGQTFTFDNKSARVITPIGRDSDWLIELPDRSQLRFDDAAFGAELCRSFGHNTFINRMEASWKWAALTLVITIVGTWGLLTYGVPIMAREVAFAVPEDLDRRLRTESIGIIDKLMFDDTELSALEIARVESFFNVIKKTDAEFAHYQIQFRASPAIGANAFAVPGGLVIVTDEMIRIVESDDEIVAILAHEIGHLAERHGLRILLQNSVSALLIAGLTGDLSNITAFSATVPTVLMQAKYSRDFERDADRFAFDYMRASGRDTNALSKLLLRIEARDDNGSSGEFDNWLSSHPRSEDRKPD